MVSFSLKKRSGRNRFPNYPIQSVFSSKAWDEPSVGESFLPA